MIHKQTGRKFELQSEILGQSWYWNPVTGYLLCTTVSEGKQRSRVNYRHYLRVSFPCSSCIPRRIVAANNYSNLSVKFKTEWIIFTDDISVWSSCDSNAKINRVFPNNLDEMRDRFLFVDFLHALEREVVFLVIPRFDRFVAAFFGLLFCHDLPFIATFDISVLSRAIPEPLPSVGVNFR